MSGQPATPLPRDDPPEDPSEPLDDAAGPEPADFELAMANPGFGNFFNRELSLLQFNYRVLQHAQDPRVPLLERLRYLSISSTNLDEFFEIRVSGLKQHIAFDVALSSADGLSPREVLTHIAAACHELVAEQYRVLNESILPALDKEGIRVVRRSAWSSAQAHWVLDYYQEFVLPVLTPVGLDPAHPFPRILNKSLNFIVELKGKDAFGRSSRAAVVQAPRLLPRLIPIPRDISGKPHEFVLLSSVIHANVGALFPGMKVQGCYQFRVTRDSDLWVDEEEVDDLLNALRGELLSRRFAGAVRLEVADNCTEEMREFLLRQFNLSISDLYSVNGPVNLHRLSALYDLIDIPRLKFPPFKPGTHPALKSQSSVFKAIRHGPLLLHHPFQSFKPVVELLNEAARDPNVLAIRQTLYRTSNDSPLVDALIEAARAGKEVTAVVELRARFDEATNIDLATRLQEAGSKVVYGIVGYKAHSKMLLIVRREGKRIRRYVHLGTGNYHSDTAKTYTDLGLLTCDEEVGEDVHKLFQQLTGLGRVTSLSKLLQSPFTLHSTIIDLIDAETAAAEAGRQARVVAKMNALIERQVIESLYRASCAGVQVELIIRGTCCLRPGVPGLSENIRVRSVLGQFLEHSRIFYFYADGQELAFASSADWMPRNFFRRVETGFPIEKKKLRRRTIEEGLIPYLEDNTQAWELQSDGSYLRVEPQQGEPQFTAQQFLLGLLSDDSLPHHDQIVTLGDED